MKTKILSILAILALSITLTYASDPQSIMEKSIRANIQFPALAVEKNLEGAVFVEFTVTADNKVEVINCTSLVGELQTYVYNKISGMTVEASPELIGQTYLMRFDFKIEK